MKKLRITIGKKTYDVTVEVLGDDSQSAERPTAIRPALTTAPPAGSQPLPSAAPGSAEIPGAVLSPMAGLVKAILVCEGDSIQAGQPLMILDAMKMENKITAPRAGTVSTIEVKEGQSVQEGQPLLALE
jgi:biotin carboxyl carrier protein